MTWHRKKGGGRGGWKRVTWHRKWGGRRGGERVAWQRKRGGRGEEREGEVGGEEKWQKMRRLRERGVEEKIEG